MIKQKRKNKFAIVALCALLIVGLVSGTLAYFSTNYSIDNMFNIGAVGARFVETFDAPDGDVLIYGGNFDKSGVLVNTGDYDLIARAKVTAKWTDLEGNDLGDVNTVSGTPDFPASVLNFGNTTNLDAADAEAFTAWAYTTTDSTGKWIYAADGWFYYNALIPGGSTSDAFLASVSISDTLGATTTQEAKYYLKTAYTPLAATLETETTAYQTAKDAYKVAYSAYANAYATWVDNGSQGTAPTKPDATALNDAKTAYEDAQAAIDALQSWVSQEAFVAANPGETASVVKVATLTYPGFENAVLVVTLSAQSIQADEEAYTAATWAAPTAVKTGWDLPSRA